MAQNLEDGRRMIGNTLYRLGGGHYVKEAHTQRM